MKKLGVNTVHLNIEEISELGLNRVEFVLRRCMDYFFMHENILKGIREAEKQNFPYSIHLPIYLYDWYKEDYLSAFYLDPMEEKRELAFKFLEANLKELSKFSAEYYVIHFAGVYKFKQDKDEFESILKESLNKLEKLAEKYKVKLLLEYFGSNFMICEIDQWIEAVEKYKCLGILCDTGHLYFSTIMHKLDFYEELEKISEKAEAFHIWTTMGKSAYSESQSYVDYHHIVVHLDQLEKDGFAFDSKKMMDIITRFNRPIIIEASEKYKGREYFISGIKSVVEGYNK